MTRSTKAVLAIAFTAALAAGTAAPAMAENHPDNARTVVQDHFPDSANPVVQENHPDSPAPLAPAFGTSEAGR
ncbi:hypothetical protein [Streptomyces sp. NPDC059850]|uniref:hypothetical protein n=1 Tax=Streptomyces sp. NPDC059850 TaxID=3346970 RepID=UPI00364DA936